MFSVQILLQVSCPKPSLLVQLHGFWLNKTVTCFKKSKIYQKDSLNHTFFSISVIILEFLHTPMDNQSFTKISRYISIFLSFIFLHKIQRAISILSFHYLTLLHIQLTPVCLLCIFSSVFWLSLFQCGLQFVQTLPYAWEFKMPSNLGKLYLLLRPYVFL